MKQRSIIARRLAYRVAFRSLTIWWFVRRPHTYGVKILLTDGDALLFVRHSYGSRGVWELPGGGRNRGESATAAATREAREELGIDVAEWEAVADLVVAHRATAHLSCMRGRYDGRPLTLDLGELEEARWALATDPPQPLGKDAAAILAMPAVAS